jgi:hypothetical protein
MRRSKFKGTKWLKEIPQPSLVELSMAQQAASQ